MIKYYPVALLVHHTWDQHGLYVVHDLKRVGHSGLEADLFLRYDIVAVKVNNLHASELLGPTMCLQ